MAAVMLVYEQIVEYYLDKIRKGALRPGDYIETEMQTAKRFDISRGTVRKAYGRMCELGYLIRRRGKGTMIAPDIFDKISRIRLGVADEVKTIGVVLVENEDFMISIIKALEERISELGWKMEIILTNNREKERYAFDKFIRMNVDGIIVIPFRSQDNSFSFSNFYRLSDSGIPYVMIGKPPLGILCDAVYAEDYVGSMNIVEELFARGCRTFLHVTDSLADNMVYHDRILGYELGARKHGQKESFLFDVRSPDFAKDLADFFRAHSEKLGVNVYSDKLLGRVYDVMQAMDRKYNVDIRIISFNENAQVRNLGFSRLSMVIPKAEIARSAMDLLCRRFQGEEDENSVHHEIFSTKLQTEHS